MDKYKKELSSYLENHDLGEEEAELLVDWVESGHSIHENPDDFVDRDGKPVSFMSWQWILSDENHPEHRRLMYHRHELNDETVQRMSWFLNGGNELLGYDAYQYLVPYISDMEEVCQEAEALSQNITYILNNIKLTGNPVSEAMDLDDAISAIEVFCELFRDSAKRLSDNNDNCATTGVYHPIFSSYLKN